MGRHGLFFANSASQGICGRKTGLPQHAPQAAGVRRGWRSQKPVGWRVTPPPMRQDVGGNEAQFGEPPACQGRKHELALQAQELLAHQRHSSTGQRSRYNWKMVAGLAVKLVAQHERRPVQRISIDPDGEGRLVRHHLLIAAHDIPPPRTVMVRP